MKSSSSKAGICALVALVIGPSRSGHALAQDPPVDPSTLKQELPRIPPREPKDALSTFRVKEGFSLELVASEPDVVDPVAMAIDEDGRMFVVEMRDYPFERGKGQNPEQDARAHPGRVRLLEDRDDDGRVDKSTVFADGLSWPTGILCWKGGVLVTAAPDILYLKDEDGDGVADRREMVFTGFGKENVQGLLNSLRWGLDNQIYGTSGSNGGDVRAAGGAPAISVRGRDFRFRPESGAFEAISGGGQFGMCFDDWGNRFVCNNSNHIRHVVLESSYLARNPYFAAPSVVKDIALDGAAAPVFRASPPEPWRLVRTRWRAHSAERSQYAATELVPIGYFTSATGITIYRGDAFPPEYRGNAFIGDVGGNLVHRKVLEPEGTTFVAHRAKEESSSEFLTSTDNWFRPVSFCEGPDGALYVLDMYRETIEHPLSIPDSIKQFLDLKSGDDRGRIYRIVPRNFTRRPKPQLAKASDEELAGHLGRQGSWWRETAQRLLFERHAGSTPGSRAKTTDLLRRSSRKEDNPLFRLHVLFTLEGMRSLEPSDLEQALSDKEPGVREAALRLAGQFLREHRLSWDGVFALADDPEARVRKEVALLLGEDTTAQGLGALARIAQKDLSEPWVRAAVLSSATDRAHELFRALLGSAPLEASSGLESLLSDLAAIVGARNQPRELSVVVMAMGEAVSGGKEALVVPSTLGLGKGLRRSGRSLSSFLSEAPEGLASALEALESLFQKAAGHAAEPSLSEARRVEWIELLSLGKFRRAEEVLPKLLDAREPRSIQIQAVRSLASFAEDKVGGILVERWKSLSPPVRREAAEAIFARQERLPALLSGLQKGVLSPLDLDPERRKLLLESVSPEVRNRARPLLEWEAPGDRKAVIEKYRGAVDLKADPRRGREIFRRACATCHKLANEGHAVAPDFATVRDKSPEAILLSILDPNKEVAPAFVAYQVVTVDGRVATGVIASENDSSVTLLRAEGVEETLLRSQIRQLESSGVSLMPEGLEKDLSVQDLADLIEAIRVAK